MHCISCRSGSQVFPNPHLIVSPAIERNLLPRHRIVSYFPIVFTPLSHEIDIIAPSGNDGAEHVSINLVKS